MKGPLIMNMDHNLTMMAKASRWVLGLLVGTTVACGNSAGGSEPIDNQLVKTREQALLVQSQCDCTPPPMPACGTSDIADKDYDHDGTPNCKDDDIDGDGLLNVDDCVPMKSFEEMVDCSLGDISTKDYDRDGIRNCEDPDIDGDGIPNVCDSQPYGK
jgi:hypothetical protein